jgi:hypothetical protein
MSEMRSVAVLRSSLIGFGVLAFTIFPPTRTLMLWGVCVQIAVMLGRMVIEHRVRDPAIAGQTLTIVELLGDGVTVALFAIGTLGGIMQLGAQV